jgi:diaminohydroxyphosphoribosylaminopyrimidine deaminase/5-amino-6-(5-phosphoribosylamino)uracil reductase
MPQTDPDVQLMKKALRLALLGAGMTSPNPLVGAVIVKQGAVVGRGYHQVLGGPHAEVNAIKDAGRSCAGATLYVTLEPCNHHGLTPPCTKAVVDAGISRVVFGMRDPNPDVAGGGGEHLRDEGIEVKGGVFEQECRLLNQPFIKYVTTGAPYVTLKAAATLDGYIAAASGDSKWITGELSRRFAHRLRSFSDGVLVGIGTVLADDPLLTVRLRGKKIRRQPVRIILDGELRIPLDSQLVRSASTSPVLVICRQDASGEKERTLGSAGIHVIRAASADSGVDLSSVLKELGAKRISSILVEGGGRVLGSFLESGLADDFHFFYAPKILGDPGGVRMLSCGPKLKIADCVRACGITTKKFADDLLVSGRFREQLY